VSLPFLVRALSRRLFCGLVAVACLLGVEPSSAGEDIPATVEAELVARLAAYDKNLKARAGAQVDIVVAVKADDPASERAAGQLAAAFARIEHIAGLPVVTTAVTYAGASSLVETCKTKHASILVITDALSSEVEKLSGGLAGSDILTFGSSGDVARRGLVLGIELVSSRPKLFINLTQAGRQNVVMSADVLKLMTVYR
jgi:hypothetical protein